MRPTSDVRITSLMRPMSPIRSTSPMTTTRTPASLREHQRVSTSPVGDSVKPHLHEHKKLLDRAGNNACARQEPLLQQHQPQPQQQQTVRPSCLIKSAVQQSRAEQAPDAPARHPMFSQEQQQSVETDDLMQQQQTTDASARQRMHTRQQQQQLAESEDVMLKQQLSVAQTSGASVKHHNMHTHHHQQQQQLAEGEDVVPRQPPSVQQTSDASARHSMHTRHQQQQQQLAEDKDLVMTPDRKRKRGTHTASLRQQLEQASQNPFAAHGLSSARVAGQSSRMQSNINQSHHHQQQQRADALPNTNARQEADTVQQTGAMPNANVRQDGDTMQQDGALPSADGRQGGGAVQQDPAAQQQSLEVEHEQQHETFLQRAQRGQSLQQIQHWQEKQNQIVEMVRAREAIDALLNMSERDGRVPKKRKQLPLGDPDELWCTALWQSPLEYQRQLAEASLNTEN